MPSITELKSHRAGARTRFPECDGPPLSNTLGCPSQSHGLRGSAIFSLSLRVPEAMVFLYEQSACPSTTGAHIQLLMELRQRAENRLWDTCTITQGPSSNHCQSFT